MEGRRVLVVDDELPVREALAFLLDRLGHSAQTASTGTEALRKLETADFDLFFVDLHMPGMKGDELAHEIKKRKPGTPVVLITGDRPHNFSRDIDRVLFKPFSLLEVRDTIASLR